MNHSIKQPEKKFRAGTVSATVGLVEVPSKATGEPQQYREVTLQRMIQHPDNSWELTQELRMCDAPKAALVLGQAYEWLISQLTPPLEEEMEVI